MLSRYTFFGRRQGNRRTDDPTISYYVDRFENRTVLAMMLVIALSGLDGVLTLWHLHAGGEELNPVMKLVIEILGGTYFLAIKYTITALGMLFLVLHKNFRGVRFLIRAIVVVYTLLIAYHAVVILMRYLGPTG